MSNKRKYWILAITLFWIGTAWGAIIKSPEVQMTNEQEQQFLYYFYKAEKLILLNQKKEARPIVEFCYELNPNDAIINMYKGFYAREDSNLVQALSFFKRAFELSPNDCWYNYNVLLLRTENKKDQIEAIANLSRVAKENPKNHEVHDVLQKAYITLGKYAYALALQDRLDSINGYNEQSAMQRYRLNAAMDNKKQAIKEIERYLEVDPENYQFQVFRLQLYTQTKQPPHKMLEAYEAVLRFDNRNMMLLNNLAWHLCICGGDLHRAEALSRTTIMAEPSNAIYLDTYAWIVFHLGDCESAWFYIQRALENQTKETSKEINEHYKTIKHKCKK